MLNQMTVRAPEELQEELKIRAGKHGIGSEKKRRGRRMRYRVNKTDPVRWNCPLDGGE